MGYHRRTIVPINQPYNATVQTIKSAIQFGIAWHPFSNRHTFFYTPLFFFLSPYSSFFFSLQQGKCRLTSTRKLLAFSHQPTCCRRPRLERVLSCNRVHSQYIKIGLVKRDGGDQHVLFTTSKHKIGRGRTPSSILYYFFLFLSLIATLYATCTKVSLCNGCISLSTVYLSCLLPTMLMI